MVFGIRRSPPILWWPMRSGLTKLLWMATRSTGLNLSSRSKADTSFTASLKVKSLRLLRPMMRTTSMFELACTNMVAGQFVVEDGIVYFSHFADQRLYRQSVGQQPRPITPPQTDALRYADGVIDRRRNRIICVQEDHTLPGKVINTLVSIDITGLQAPRILACGNDSIRHPG